jgi:hypothetical protein
VALIHDVHGLVESGGTLLERLEEVELALLVRKELLVMSHAHANESLAKLVTVKLMA